MSKIVDILMDVAKQGYAIDELKNSCLKELGSFFENRSVLEKYWTSSELLSAYEFIIRYRHDEIFTVELQQTLQCYRKALSKDNDSVIDIISKTLFDFSQKENMMFSVRKNVDSLNTSNLFERTMFLMKHVGEILEIGTKHLVNELWAMVQIQEEIVPNYEKICSLDFGVVIQNLLVKDKFPKVLQTNPIALKLSDWRNIAYHHTYRIVDNTIVCFYGKNRASFTINLQELEQYTYQIVRSSNILNIARCFFVFDNLPSLQKHPKKPPNISNIYFRDDLLEESLRISLLSQSFLLDKVEVTDEYASITVIDLHINNSDDDADKKRRIHSTQFLYEVWHIYHKDKVEVKYATVQGGVCFVSSVDGDICKKIASDEKDISYLARHFDFTII